jgi:hypothetical protein
MDIEDAEDLQIVEIQGGPAPVYAGVTQSGDVYLRGDLHPLGSASALLAAAAQHVPYVAITAIQVLFPADWLRGECLHDMDRLRIIDNMERLVRGA